MKHTIWSELIRMEDWTDFCEEEGLDPNSDEAYERVVDLNSEYLFDEYANCKVDTERPLIIFANLGLWNGHRQAFMRYSYLRLSDALESIGQESAELNGYLDLYVEDGEICADIHHHDGTNFYHIRELKPDISTDDLENYTFDQLWLSTVPAGKYPAKVYGWTEF